MTSCFLWPHLTSSGNILSVGRNARLGEINKGVGCVILEKGDRQASSLPLPLTQLVTSSVSRSLIGWRVWCLVIGWLIRFLRLEISGLFPNKLDLAVTLSGVFMMLLFVWLFLPCVMCVTFSYTRLRKVKNWMSASNPLTCWEIFGLVRPSGATSELNVQFCVSAAKNISCLTSCLYLRDSQNVTQQKRGR